MALTIVSYLLVAAFCFVAGVTLDRLLFHGRRSASSGASDDPTERVAHEVLRRVQMVTERIMVDVHSHGATVRNVDDQLHTVDVGRDGIDGVVQLVAELVESNETIQGKLTDAESKLDKLAEQMAKHHNEARTDSLTGCANRRAFDEEMAFRLNYYKESGEAFSLVMIDIDHFKNVNDTHGHHVGDAVLRTVGATLRELVRRTDVIARYGGEEFAVIMPTAGIKDACRAAEALRKRIEQQVIAIPDGKLNVTISAGAADLSHLGDENDPIQYADAALYAAKSAGRNRVYWHDGEQPHPLEDLKEPASPAEPDRKSSAVPNVVQADAQETARQEEAAAIFENLPTKTAFFQEVRRRIAEWNRGGQKVSVGLVSLDNWREIEETHGAQGSYRALCAVAARLKDCVREMDLVARYDGAVFGVMLPTASEQSALVIGERLRKSVEADRVTIGGQAVALKVSCGTAQVGQGDEDAVPLLRRAEEAMEAQRGTFSLVRGSSA